ncbi:uncharacterized protein MONBRDRAFT_27624 [Monosiga brevicollis MX1]|uniref:Ribosomal protein S6 kinase n=1 Tax=Monosiga brevicollis TaxID=81824 RepID=A9V5U3_MONBE|nr:uncharacterized protein MONBRDRAFT_27624 [Monosiga brevicollis MX1]EDQ87175.1 predicted protein [Monosiga brevicollis MX1]|eukprot:XP_001748118.1 hypothetical protein [Monosiga brevicollis MX1]
MALPADFCLPGEGSSDFDFSNFGEDSEIFPITEASMHPSDGERVGPADFELLRVLGSGAYGKVMLTRKVTGNDTGTLYAMKVLKKAAIVRQAKMTEHTRAERNILESIRHVPFVVQLHYAFQDESKLHLVLDYVNGGELFTHLRRRVMFLEREARFYVAEILVALDALHRLGVIYRDLKLENILLDKEGHVRLTDFGLSKEHIQSPAARTYSYAGTTEYLAPEIAGEHPEGHGLSVDWWSLGCLLYELVQGHTPFVNYPGDTDNSNSAIARRILTKPAVLHKSMSKPLRGLLTGLLEKRAEKRLGAHRDAAELMEHAFFKPLKWEDLRDKKVPPPIVPVIANELDTQNFDSEFTDQDPVLTPAPPTSPTARMLFRGFSFVGPNVLFNSGLFDPEASQNATALQSSLQNVVSVQQVVPQANHNSLPQFSAEIPASAPFVPPMDASGNNTQQSTASLQTQATMPEDMPQDESANMGFVDVGMARAEPRQPLKTALGAIPPSALTSQGATASSSPIIDSERTFHMEYTIPAGERELGLGSFSTCRKCIRKSDNAAFAVKIVSNRGQTQEAEMLRRVQGHPNIIQLIDVFQDPVHTYIVMELCTGGELFYRIAQHGNLSEREARNIFKQLVSAVQYSHNNNVVHRDLKPENIVFQEASVDSPVKIIDWGFAKLTDTQQTLQTPLFTFKFGAPEVTARLKSSAPAYTSACDMWSLGVILYTMLTGATPFEVPANFQDADAWDKVLRKELQFTQPIWQHISAEAKQLLQRLLSHNAHLRPTATLAARDPWLTEAALSNQPLPSPAILAKEETAGRGKRGILAANVAALSDASRLAPVEDAKLAKRRKQRDKSTSSVSSA